MRDAKLILSMTVLGLLVVFTIQNVEIVQVHFLLWTLEIRRAFLLFVVLACGVLIGWWLHGHRGSRRSADRGRSDERAGPS